MLPEVEGVLQVYKLIQFHHFKSRLYIAQCNSLSVVQVLFWNGRVSHGFQWCIACETLQFQCCNHASD